MSLQGQLQLLRKSEHPATTEEESGEGHGADPGACPGSAVGFSDDPGHRVPQPPPEANSYLHTILNRSDATIPDSSDVQHTSSPHQCLTQLPAFTTRAAAKTTASLERGHALGIGLRAQPHDPICPHGDPTVMGSMITIQTDSRSRVVLPGHPEQMFVMQENPDGSILLQPARVVTEAQD